MKHRLTACIPSQLVVASPFFIAVHSIVVVAVVACVGIVAAEQILGQVVEEGDVDVGVDSLQVEVERSLDQAAVVGNSLVVVGEVVVGSRVVEVSGMGRHGVGVVEAGGMHVVEVEAVGVVLHRHPFQRPVAEEVGIVVAWAHRIVEAAEEEAVVAVGHREHRVAAVVEEVACVMAWEVVVVEEAQPMRPVAVDIDLVPVVCLPRTMVQPMEFVQQPPHRVVASFSVLISPPILAPPSIHVSPFHSHPS